MSIVLIDGFDHYPTGNYEYETDSILALETVENYTVVSASILPSDRSANQGKCLGLDQTGLSIIDTSWWAATSGTNQDTIHVAFALKIHANTADNNFFLYIRSPNNNIQCSLYRNGTTGLVKAYKATNVELADSGSNVMAVDTWYWIEVKAKVAVSGTMELKVDGTTWISYSGDTRPYDETPRIAGITLKGTSSFSPTRFWYFDDLVLQDDSDDSAFLGDSRVTTLFPRTDSISPAPDFATYPNTGDDNAKFVSDDNEAKNEDDYYVYSSTTGDEDYYAFDTIDSADTIHAVSLHYKARKTDSAERTMQSVVSSGTQTGATKTLATNYQYFHDVFETSDGSTTAWNQTTVGSSEYGIKVTS